MRGIKGLIWETSLLDAEEVRLVSHGISSVLTEFHEIGYSIPWHDYSRMSKGLAKC